MGNAEEKVWLVTLTDGTTTGHRLYSTGDRAGEGLRGMFEDMWGLDDLPPEVITQTEAFDEIEGYEGSYTIDDRQISWLVIPLPVDDL